MAKPTNEELITKFPDIPVSAVDADTELWSITTKILVKKGTDVEQLSANIAQGRFDPATSVENTIAIGWVDFTKLS